EREKLVGELRKEARLERPAPEAPPAPATTKKVEPEKKPAPEKKEEPQKKAEPDRRTELEKRTESLTGFQQLLAARVRVLDERDDRPRDLRRALNDLQKKASAHNTTLAEVRQLALQLGAAASDLKKRVGMGELPGDRVPNGVTEALRVELRTRLDADAAGALATLTQVAPESEQLRRRDPEGDALKAVIKELFAVVGERLDLLADVKKLTAEYRREKKDRPASEVKRLDQVAADRQSADGSNLDLVLGIGSSKTAKTLEELLEAYYQELAEIEDKEENPRTQKEKNGPPVV